MTKGVCALVREVQRLEKKAEQLRLVTSCDFKDGVPTNMFVLVEELFYEVGIPEARRLELYGVPKVQLDAARSYSKSVH